MKTTYNFILNTEFYQPFCKLKPPATGGGFCIYLTSELVGVTAKANCGLEVKASRSCLA
jgi:hypothetical protein